MIIEKVKSRKYRNIQYYKYRVIIPEKKIKEANFKEGDKLEVEVERGEMKLKKKRSVIKTTH